MISGGRPARTIDVAERRARLGARHRLAPRHRAGAPDEVARSVVALHATDPPSVHLAVAARLERPSVDPVEAVERTPVERAAPVRSVERPSVDPVEAVEAALYDHRTMVRILGMRRTMFVVPVEAVGVVHASSTRAVATRERRRLAGYLEAGGVDDGSAWIDRAADDVLRVLRERGEATTADLSAAVPALAQRIEAGAGTRWAVESTAASRLVALLAAEERVVRGRPRGPWWRASPHRWAPLDAWAPRAVVPDDLDTAGAQARLATWWLRSFGPGTLDDLAWWTGWTRTATRAAVRAVGAVEVDLGGETGLVLPDDLDPATPVEPWVALLPALDPTAMGWKGRAWYLGPHRAALFDRNGNVGPTVWSDGRVVGGWAQRSDGQVAFRLLEDVGAEAATAVEVAAAVLTDLLAEARVVPRFRTPLERDLVAA